MESETSVRTLFRAFKSQQESLESSTAQPSSAAYQEKLQAAISTLDECRRLVDQSSLFSPNETEDDIASGDLQ